MSKIAKCLGGAGIVGVVVAARPGTRANRYLRRQMETAARRARYYAGRLQGAAYEAAGNAPDPNVDDRTLADRIRSTIGPLVRDLDIPHVHVLVENHVALLHGEVGRAADAAQIETAVAAVSGVVGVESYLHLGLVRSDTRPSEGKRTSESNAFRALVAAAESAGAPAELAPIAVRGTLATFAELIPEGERAHVKIHLPADVAPLLEPAHRLAAAQTHKPTTVDQFVQRVMAADGDVSPDRAPVIAQAIVAALHDLVVDEQADVAAVLPRELRVLWLRDEPEAPQAEAAEKPEVAEL